MPTFLAASLQFTDVGEDLANPFLPIPYYSNPVALGYSFLRVHGATDRKPKRGSILSLGDRLARSSAVSLYI